MADTLTRFNRRLTEPAAQRRGLTHPRLLMGRLSPKPRLFPHPLTVTHVSGPLCYLSLRPVNMSIRGNWTSEVCTVCHLPAPATYRDSAPDVPLVRGLDDHGTPYVLR
jgi:hypothetical protein